MKFSRAASYNNPHEMFPSASKLFSGMNTVAGNVTTSKGQGQNGNGKGKMDVLKEEGKCFVFKRGSGLPLLTPSFAHLQLL